MVSVSIITPLYNCSNFLHQTVQSVLEQTSCDWEMIMVDDFSTDNTLEVAQQYAAQDERIKLIQLTKNSGAAVARNTGIEAAQGRYIAFLDSDDKWLSKKLETQLYFMQENNYPFTFAAYDKVNESDEIFGHVGVPSKVAYSDLLKSCSIGCLTAMYDTEFFGKVYMPLIRKRQDLGLWLKLLKKTKYAYGLKETLGLYKVRSDSISANKKSAALFTWRLYREVEQINLLKSIYYFSHYAVRGLLRTKYPGVARALGILK
tara:strand:+ start:3628 stop:4407 length:780 start_codon:yes stop_codon:yes gene_type:complete